MTDIDDVIKALECQRPPRGWRCTRSVGHEGPCAAIPLEPEPEPAEDSMPGLLVLASNIAGGLLCLVGIHKWIKVGRVKACVKCPKVKYL